MGAVIPRLLRMTEYFSVGRVRTATIFFSLSLRSSSILFLKVFLSDIYGLTRRREVFVWLRKFGASFPPA